MSTMRTQPRSISDDSEIRLSSADISRFFWLRGGLMLKVILSITLLAALLAYVTPGSYTSKGTILIERGKSPTFRSDPIRYELDAAEVINSEIGIMTSRTVAEDVIDRLALDRQVPTDSFVRRAKERLRGKLIDIGLSEEQTPRARLIRRLGKQLKVKQVPNSSLVSISYRADDAAFATVVARTFMDASIERHREIYSDTSATFFETRFRESERSLERLRETISRETDPAKIQGLTLQKEALETTYRFYRERWDRAKADAAGDVSMVNVRAVDYPAVPLRRDQSRLFMIVIAFAASIVFALAVAMIWHYFDHTVYDPSDLVSNVNVPVLGSVRRSRAAGRIPR